MRMETCCWCTPVNSVTSTLKSYASSSMPLDKFIAANEDLCYCLECVDEYHKVKDEMPTLRKILWKRETTRLIAHFEKSMPEDDIFILANDEEGWVQCLDSDFEKKLRVPLLEVLKYPYLLLHRDLSRLFVEAICKMEAINCPCQVLGKHPGVYLLMVHPNETIRRWAITTAKNLGKVDRDDYYDIQEVLTCLLRVIELDLFETAYAYNPTAKEMGNLFLLPDHLYDMTSFKNYWLGICMVLMVLDEQAMDSLLLGPDIKFDFMECIIRTLEKDNGDESNTPFWPALHCFMVTLDKLGCKVWGQRIDPMEAFQTINNSVSYKKEIENIRQRCKRTRSEPLSNCEDEMVTCSQLVYDYQLEKAQKVTGQKYAACPDYFPDLYEEMRKLIDAFQLDFGQDIRLHNSTFLWLIPFIHSLMGLRDLGVGYSVHVMNHLCLKADVSENLAESYDRVSQFFIWVLVIVIQLHLKKKCLRSLWISAEKWVQTVVAWAKLPCAVFMAGTERRAARSCLRSKATPASVETESVQTFCMKLIRNILKEGLHDEKIPVCKQYLIELNLLLRTRMNWELSPQQTDELQGTLKHIIRNMWIKSGSPSPTVENPPTFVSQNQEDMCPSTEGQVQEGSMLTSAYTSDEMPHSIRRNQRNKSAASGTVAATSTTTDSQIDVVSSKTTFISFTRETSFSVDSRQESSKKVMDSVQSRSSREDELPSKAAIIISDSSDEEENLGNTSRESSEYDICASHEKQSSSQGQEPMNTSPANAEHESQLFEFEAEDVIYSERQDSQMDEEVTEDSGVDAGCSSHIDSSVPTGLSGNAPPQAEPARSTPAVVPPAKVHHFPPPASQIEALELSKKVRRAPELSQRTQDHLTELRHHGEIAGRVNVARKRTLQLTNAPHITAKKRKMLSGQELQFYRQTRPKERERGERTHGGNPSSSILEATASKPSPLTSTDSSSSSCDEDEASKEGKPQLNENIEDDDIFLTQLDPVDMELCSQIECGSSPTHMEVSVSASPLQEANELCKEAGSDRAAEAGAHSTSCAVGGPQDNAPANTFAPPRLSTVKIFSISSRSANLTKDLESTPKLPAIPKSKSNPFKPPTSKGNRLQSKTPVPNSILQPQNSNNVPQLPNVQNNSVYTGGVLPLSRPVSWREMNPRFTQGNSVNAQQRNPALFIREILKWNYDMFAQFSQFGAPSFLLQSVISTVPVTFKDYNDHFNTFLSLMMLNTFETIVEGFGYGQSLMERLCRHFNGQLWEKVIDRLQALRLTTQYRMHADISLFPSNYVYDRALKTDRPQTFPTVHLEAEDNEFAEFSQLAMKDLDSAIKELEEFISHIRTVSDSAIKQLAGRDLVRFRNFKKKGIAVWFGKFSKKENDQLRQNVEAFLKETGIESAEKLLFVRRFPQERISININMLKAIKLFGAKIAQGIPRPWRLVYYRARKMYDPKNYNGRYSDKEKEKLKKYQAMYGNNWKKISDLMSRSSHSVETKFSEMRSGVKYGPWDSEEIRKLVQAIQEALLSKMRGSDSASEKEDEDGELTLTYENLRRGISWTQVEAKVGTRSWKQCKDKWNLILTQKIMGKHLRKSRLEHLQINIALIERLYEVDADDVEDIDWEKIASAIGNDPPFYIRRKFYGIKSHYMRHWNNRNFMEIIHHLYEVILPMLKKQQKELMARTNITVEPQQVEDHGWKNAFKFSNIFNDYISNDDSDDDWEN